MRAVLRVPYRIVRAPARIVDEAVLPLFFDGDAAVRLACDHLLVDCDRLAARRLDDTAAAARAEMLRHRRAATCYAIARRQRRILARSDAVLAGHRERFEQRRRADAARLGAENLAPSPETGRGEVSNQEGR